MYGCINSYHYVNEEKSVRRQAEQSHTVNKELSIKRLRFILSISIWVSIIPQVILVDIPCSLVTETSFRTENMRKIKHINRLIDKDNAAPNAP